MKKILADIQDNTFAKDFVAECEAGKLRNEENSRARCGIADRSGGQRPALDVQLAENGLKSARQICGGGDNPHRSHNRAVSQIKGTWTAQSNL